MFTALVLALSTPISVETTPIPTLEEATTRIAQRDAQMFYSAFEGCDPEDPPNHARRRFPHAPRSGRGGGVLARGVHGDDLRTMRLARTRRANEGYANRRLLVPGSDQVTPLGEWGVLHRGYHTFLEWRGEEQGWVQTGGAYFINVWQWDGARGVFLMQETISVDHGAQRPYP